ncbi:MAG: histidine phosphatase family protein [Ferrimicrobium sp.]|uniref:Histidine phosphatase family protein n=1 Tax=Ferrimicrobium acidiphilum TaxID=121039 RepID=A0ABV3Y8U3_9ACTN|nr:histidine phosphatase family protein [Ferrimicrobium sp.]
MCWWGSRDGNDRREAVALSPPPTRLILVRHGATPTTGKILPGRAVGLHLADYGHRQAAAVADQLPARFGAITALLTSPLERAQETAQPLSERLGMTPKIEPRLVECDFGEWTGASLAKLYRKPAWRELMMQAGNFRFPGGESLREVLDRMLDLVSDLRTHHKSETIVGFTHADPIKILTTEALGMHIDQMHRISVATASMTAFVISEVGINLDSLNTGSLIGGSPA